MAQRVSGTARKSGVGRTARLDYASRVSEAQAARAIPLNLGPMLAVYKNRRRLSLRIERMPPLARLSAGRNNGDNSWSLSFSEIDTLAYLPPEGSTDESLTLSVRIIDLDGGGSTLAVLDLSVSPTAAEDRDKADVSASEVQLRALHEELEKAKAALKARDADLAQLRQKAQRAESELSRQRIETEFGGGRGGSRKGEKGEIDESKFAALSATLLMREGGANPLPQADSANDEPVADSEEAPFLVRKGQAQPSKLMPADQTAQGALSEETVLARIAEARENWQKERDEALARAEAAWKADEAKKLSSAAAQWQAQSTSELAQVSARCERAEKALADASARVDALAARDKERGLELVRQTQQCEELKKALAQRASAMAQASVAGEKARDAFERASEHALARAEAAWRADEAARMAAAEAQWRSQSSNTITALTARCERAEQALTQADAHSEFATQRDSNSAAEIRRLRDECTALRTRVTARDADLGRAHQEHVRARESTERETKETFSRAEANWKTEAAARLAAAESAWQQKLKGALAEANARAERAESVLAEVNRRIETLSSRDRDNNGEVERLRKECAMLKASLDERGSAVAGVRQEFDDARKTWRQETAATLENAAAAWKAAEATRLAAAEASWKGQAAGALAQAQARCQNAEKALADANARTHALAAQDEGNTSELRRLRDETASLQAMLAEREVALKEVRTVFDREREQWQQEAQQSLVKAEAAWRSGEAARFMAANVQWQEKLARVSEEARTEIEASRARSGDDRLGEEVSQLRAQLVEREKAMAQAHLPLAEAQACWQRDAQESMAAAAAAWKVEEAARLKSAEAQWRRQSDSAAAELTLRCERAEQDAQEFHAQAEAVAARDQNNRFELRRLLEELSVAQANLASRDAELAEARAQEARLTEPEIILKPGRIGNLRDIEDEKPKSKSHLIRDIAIVACLGVAAVLVYPHIESYVPQLGALSGSTTVSYTKAAAPAAAPRPSAVVIRAANVRAGPSANTATSGTLQPGTKVEPVEKKGNWTHIRIESATAAIKEGWIFSEFLQDEKPAAAKAPAAKPK